MEPGPGLDLEVSCCGGRGATAKSAGGVKVQAQMVSKSLDPFGKPKKFGFGTAKWGETGDTKERHGKTRETGGHGYNLGLGAEGGNCFQVV